ncbi:mechanosensitive ion channel [Nitrogeniibacter mangrovi]|uniref:Small-conductance mechanosensitive channel n=1 Tax=Nitrogeniibacter mangrovi TaxID=2016596 RepID=A0A6C1BA99_9RHOO|nr:mechanosensitive ion channel domain-containing protein [Nitrogeniibacter mangrovi]QID19618.1 mechanosensitive ion channel [Nitrogeniibacter mangrovi]
MHNLLDSAGAWLINLAIALVIFFLGRYAVKLIVSIARRMLARSSMDEMLANFVLSILTGVLLLVVIIAALDQLGVDTTSLVALIGAAGLAIGLSLQDSLKNFAAGVMLIVFRPFKAGDFVEAAGTQGVVETISIFSSTFRTPDNRTIVIPNGAIYSGVITNYSARETRRIDLIIGISYDDDIRKAKDVAAAVLEAEPRVLDDPAPVIAVAELGASSVDLHIRPWVKSADYFATMCDLKEAIKIAYDDNGISIPYPQTDLHVHQVLPKHADAAPFAKATEAGTD